MEKLTRGKRASGEQKAYLINYLEENLDVANDKFVTADGAKHRDQKWKNLAVSLNALGGTQKDGQRWKKYWSDLKLNTRAKYSELKKAEQRSGVNGLSRLKSLTSLEERVIEITTVEAVDGDGTPEVGFENSTFLENNNGECCEDDIIVADRNIADGTTTTCALTATSTASTSTTVNKSAPALTSSTATRSRKRKQQHESLHFDKFFKMDEKKLEELKMANILKREQISILKEQVEATKIQTEAIKANTLVKENLAETLQQLISMLVEKYAK